MTNIVVAAMLFVGPPSPDAFVKWNAVTNVEIYGYEAQWTTNLNFGFTDVIILPPAVTTIPLWFRDYDKRFFRVRAWNDAGYGDWGTSAN